MKQEELLRQVAKGDREAFHQLYLDTDRSVYSFILSILKNPQDAEEVLQETYLKIWISAGSYKPQGKPLAWMFTIARNLCYMKFRDQKRMADIGLDELSGEETGELCLPLEQMTDAMMLKAALEILKEDERQIVLLHASSGLKQREIASGLGMPLPTVLSKYNRAMKKLQNYLREEG
ncbi:MAG TPA: RNA polymerase sigma factor [Lachnoclostridium sp.]|nr:RNA polymerase sigma factor [Lachnoclostridium sp.]